MQNRPYFNFKGEQLQQLIDDNQSDLELLGLVLVELQHRSTPKMKALRSKIERSIAGFNNDTGNTKTGVPPKDDRKKQESRQSQPQKPEQEDLFGDKYSSQKETKKTATCPEGATESKAKEKANNSGKREPNEEPLREPRMGKMRKPGKIAGVPAKRSFDLKDEVKLDVSKDAPLVVRYEAAVRELVAEMRRKKTAYKQVILEDGVRMQLDGKENGYQFPYNEDAELFEGAAVVAVIGGMQSEGRIIAFLGKQIVISLLDDFGPRIAVCILRIDNTAMLEALRVRLEKIAKGDAVTFNAKLAEAVIFNTGNELAPAFVPNEFVSDLNSCQKEAVAKILANEIFYLWGPPGTGKTKTLGALCLALIEGNKRILLCSNTNQAVDQVLLKICDKFKITHPAIQEGQVVRVGQIANKQLLEKWKEYVTIDGIVERKSRALLARKEELEIQLERINSSMSRANRLMKAFALLDGLIAERESVSEIFQQNQKKRNTDLERKLSLEKRIEDLQAEKQKVQLAGAIKRAFLRSIERIEKDLQKAGVDLLAKEKQLETIEDKIRDLKARLGEIDTAINPAEQAVSGIDRRGD